MAGLGCVDEHGGALSEGTGPGRFTRAPPLLLPCNDAHACRSPHARWHTAATSGPLGSAGASACCASRRCAAPVPAPSCPLCRGLACPARPSTRRPLALASRASLEETTIGCHSWGPAWGALERAAASSHLAGGRAVAGPPASACTDGCATQPWAPCTQASVGQMPLSGDCMLWLDVLTPDPIFSALEMQQVALVVNCSARNLDGASSPQQSIKRENESAR